MTSFSLIQASSRTPAVIPRQSRTNWAFSERVSRNVCIQTILCDKNEKHLKRSSGAAVGRPDFPPVPPKKIFFHPDCTVGTGITPVQLSLADFTAGRELHPALKNILNSSLLTYICNVTHFEIICNLLSIFFKINFISF